jgi:hypothetical protein
MGIGVSSGKGPTRYRGAAAPASHRVTLPADAPPRRSGDGMGRVEGKVAIVTGAVSGLGAADARVLAK